MRTNFTPSQLTDAHLVEVERNLRACVHCGICDVVCPDMCFVWETEDDGGVRLRGIDYQYCKGCRKCTEACPTGALTEIREEEGWAAAHRVPLFPWLEPEAKVR